MFHPYWTISFSWSCHLSVLELALLVSQRVSKPSLSPSLLSWLAPRSQACLALMISGLRCSSLALEMKGSHTSPLIFLQACHWFISSVDMSLLWDSQASQNTSRFSLVILLDGCNVKVSAVEVICWPVTLKCLLMWTGHFKRFCPTYVPQQLTGLWENIFIVQLSHSSPYIASFYN